MQIKRLKVSDYWVWPEPIEPGMWRVSKRRILRRSGRWAYSKPNRFAWKIKQQCLGHEVFDDIHIFGYSDFFDSGRIYQFYDPDWNPDL